MAKVIGKLSKRSRDPIKSLKQQLCDRINQCKTLEELKGWKRTFSYYPVLKNTQDFDYGFLIDLIEFKLKRMSDYFHSHNIVENEDWYGTLCDRALNILNAGYLTNIIRNDDLHTHVNTRNVHRFFTSKQLEFISDNRLRHYYLPTVREAKAKVLFWKFMNHYIEYLWD